MDCLLGGPSRARCLARDGLAVSASARSGRLGPRRAGSFQALPGLRGSAPDSPARPIPAAASEPGTEAPLPATGTRRIMRGWPVGGDEEPEDSFPRPVRIRHPGRSEAESRDLNAVAPPALRPRIFAAARLVRGDEKAADSRFEGRTRGFQTDRRGPIWRACLYRPSRRRIRRS